MCYSHVFHVLEFLSCKSLRTNKEVQNIKVHHNNAQTILNNSTIFDLLNLSEPI